MMDQVEMRMRIAPIGVAYILYHGTGCTCCGESNYMDGLYLFRENAEQKAAASYKNSTLRSQYADNGVHNVVAVRYDMAGRFIILDEKVAREFGGFTDDPSGEYADWYEWPVSELQYSTVSDDERESIAKELADQYPTFVPHKTYTTQPDEVLSEIAANHGLLRADSTTLFEWNRHVLKDPHVIPGGVTLILPDAREWKILRVIDGNYDVPNSVQEYGFVEGGRAVDFTHPSIGVTIKFSNYDDATDRAQEFERQFPNDTIRVVPYTWERGK